MLFFLKEINLHSKTLTLCHISTLVLLLVLICTFNLTFIFVELDFCNTCPQNTITDVNAQNRKIGKQNNLKVCEQYNKRS